MYIYIYTVYSISFAPIYFSPVKVGDDAPNRRCAGGGWSLHSGEAAGDGLA